MTTRRWLFVALFVNAALSALADEWSGVVGFLVAAWILAASARWSAKGGDRQVVTDR